MNKSMATEKGGGKKKTEKSEKGEKRRKKGKWKGTETENLK